MPAPARAPRLGPPQTVRDQEALWAALARDAFDIVSSDHSPFRFADPKGKQIAGANAGFHKVPNGIPGVETRLPLLFSECVLAVSRSSSSRWSFVKALPGLALAPLRVSREAEFAVWSNAGLAADSRLRPLHGRSRQLERIRGGMYANRSM